MGKPKLSACPYCENKDIRLLNDEVCYFVWCTNIDCPRKRINCFATAEEAIEDWEKEANDERN